MILGRPMELSRLKGLDIYNFEGTNFEAGWRAFLPRPPPAYELLQFSNSDSGSHSLRTVGSFRSLPQAEECHWYRQYVSITTSWVKWGRVAKADLLGCPATTL